MLPWTPIKQNVIEKKKSIFLISQLVLQKVVLLSNL